MGIESSHSTLIEPASDPEKDERAFEYLFTTTGVQAWDAIDGNDLAQKEQSLQALEALFVTPDVQKVRLPGEDEVFEAYQTLCKQLDKKLAFKLNSNGDIVALSDNASKS